MNTTFYISAERAQFDSKVNATRTNLLRGLLIASGFSFEEVQGCYHEEGQEEPSVEVSFKVKTNNQKAIERLAKGFQQDAILRQDGLLGSLVDFINNQEVYIGKATHTKEQPTGCYTRFNDGSYMYFR